jgi:hypothetical protein
MADEIFTRLIHYDEVKDIQVRLSVNEFRGVEYLSLRKWYRDFEGEWAPSNEGVNMPLDLNNSRELFAGLIEILSLAEAKDVIIDHFKDLMRDTFQ